MSNSVRNLHKKSKITLFMLCAALGALSGCGGGGGGGGSGGGSVSAPAPVISQLAPATGTVGCGAVDLTVTGSNFSASSAVQWNGTTLPTTYVSATQLTTVVPVADISNAGTENVTVANSGNASNAMPFTVASATNTDAVAYQINPGHSGLATFSCNVTLPTKSAWQVDLGGTPSFALIAEGKVFVTVTESGISTLVALDQASGATVWGPIALSKTVSAAYDAGQIFVINGGIGVSGSISAYNATTGKLNWSTELSEQWWFVSGVAATNGFVYTFGSGDGGTIYALNETTGAVTWTGGTMAGTTGTPAVSSTGVYFSSPCQTNVFAPATGSALWSNNTGCDGGGGATPVVANGVLYSPVGIGAYTGLTFNATTGATLGTYTTDNTPSIDANNGYFLQSGTLRGISLANNTVLWNFTGDSHLVTSPITVNQYTFIGSSSGQLYAVSNSTGQQVWNVNVGSAFPNGAGWSTELPLTGLSAGDGLLVVPSGNSLIAYSLIGAN